MKENIPDDWKTMDQSERMEHLEREMGKHSIEWPDDDVPIIGACFWTEAYDQVDRPPEHWHTRVCGGDTIYGRGIKSSTVVYTAFEPENVSMIPSFVFEAIGEIFVHDSDDNVVARFPFYPRHLEDPPDYPGWKHAKHKAEGYAARLVEEQ